MTDHKFLPYGRQLIDDDDIASVVAVLRSDWLTTGPLVEQFEERLAREVGAREAVVCNSGTAALYLAARTAGLEPGDFVIVPTITFVASASAFVLAGFEVGFSDVHPDTGLMSATHLESAIRRLRASGVAASRIKGVVPVHLAGRVEGLEQLSDVASQNGMVVVEDACHALGGTYGDGQHQVGSCGHSLATCFSFHPVKTIAMGEGGAVTTNSADLATHARRLRNHGLERNVDAIQCREMALDDHGALNPWYYEVPEISHNLRASDINCALGLSQMEKLRQFVAARRVLARRYESRIAELAPAIKMVSPAEGTDPGWHLCCVLVDFAELQLDRAEFMRRLKASGVGTQVHYVPVHLQPYYRARYGKIELPDAVRYYDRTLSLPLFPQMSEPDVDFVVDCLQNAIDGRCRPAKPGPFHRDHPI